MRRVRISTLLCLIVLSLFSFAGKPVAARDILLIDDYAGGFGGTAGVLSSAGHTVTELTDELAGGYSRVSDAAFLSNYDMVVYASRHTEVPPAIANAAMESYISNGGDLLITGFQSPVLIPDRSAPDLLRALGPEYIYYATEPSHTVSSIDNYITNGPYGDYRGASIASSEELNALFANTGLGTIPLVQAADGQPDKIIFTDLPGAGGSIGAWQGGSRATGAAAQPEFFDGGTFQGMLLNWAEGGTTTQTEVTPRVFSTALHPLESTAAIDLYLGDPNNGGSFVTTVGPINIEGTMDIVGALDGSGDGTLAITNTSVAATNLLNYPVDLGFLGTAEVDLGVLDLYVANQTTNVSANGFDLNASPYLVAGISELELSIHSVMGPLEDLAGDLLPLDLDLPYVFYADPSLAPGAEFDGTFDEGAGLFTDRAEVNLAFDDVAVFIISLEGLGDVWGVIHGEIHVAYVPEPSSWLLGCVAVFGFVAIRRPVRYGK